MNEEELFKQVRELSDKRKFDLAISKLYNNFLHKESFYRFNDEACKIWLQQGRCKKVFERYRDVLLLAEDFPVYKDSIALYAESARNLNKNLYADMLETYIRCLDNDFSKGKEREQYWDGEQAISDFFAESDLNQESLTEITSFYVKYWKSVEAVIFYLLMKEMAVDKTCLSAVYETLIYGQKAETLIQMFEEGPENVCIICEGNCPHEEEKLRNIAWILNVLGFDVYLILPPVSYESFNSDFDINSLLKIIFTNMELIQDIKCFRPIQIKQDNNIILNTQYYLLEEINNIYFKEDAALLIADQVFTKQMFQNTELRKKLQILFQYHAKTDIPQYSVSFLGEYFYAAKYLYGIDVPKLICEEPKFKFSIIIPTRNAKETLKYTLQTCLEQDFDDYEIVVSDNSDVNNTGVLETVKNFKSSRIRYIKPPRYLPMNKNFEYAYFCSNGEYVLSLGSDDALMTYSLRILNEIIQQIPEENVIAWERLLYMWPSMKRNSSDCCHIPLVYKLPIALQKTDSKELLKCIKQEFNYIYYSPQIYINSCMKKQYIKKIVETTGKFLDGLAPDSYLGPLNLLLNPYFFRVEFPLSIAGMSESSNGASSFRNVGKVGMEHFEKSKMFYTSYFLQENPQPEGGELLNSLGLNSSYIYDLFHILINKNINSYDLLENIDYVSLLWDTINMLPDTYETDIWIEKLRQSAKQLGEGIYLEIEQRMAKRLQDIYSQEPNDGEIKTYHKGLSQNQNFTTIDASEFGIDNIVKMRDFIQKLFHFV